MMLNIYYMMLITVALLCFVRESWQTDLDTEGKGLYCAEAISSINAPVPESDAYMISDCIKFIQEIITPRKGSVIGLQLTAYNSRYISALVSHVFITLDVSDLLTADSSALAGQLYEVFRYNHIKEVLIEAKLSRMSLIEPLWYTLGQMTQKSWLLSLEYTPAESEPGYEPDYFSTMMHSILGTSKLFRLTINGHANREYEGSLSSLAEDEGGHMACNQLVIKHFLFEEDYQRTQYDEGYREQPILSFQLIHLVSRWNVESLILVNSDFGESPLTNLLGQYNMNLRRLVLIDTHMPKVEWESLMHDKVLKSIHLENVNTKENIRGILAAARKTRRRPQALEEISIADLNSDNSFTRSITQLNDNFRSCVVRISGSVAALFD